jgi:hypothetical protein
MKIQFLVEYYNKKKKILIAKNNIIECTNKTNTYYLCNYDGVNLHIPLTIAYCVQDKLVVAPSKEYRKPMSEQFKANVSAAMKVKHNNQKGKKGTHSKKIGFEKVCGVAKNTNIIFPLPVAFGGLNTISK